MEQFQIGLRIVTVRRRLDGRVALPEGDANDHATSGVLDIWHVRKVQKVG